MAVTMGESLPSNDAAATTDDLDNAPLEDPVGHWVGLVEACHIRDKTLRDEKVKHYLNLARASRWTQQILNQIDEDFYDSEEEATVGWEQEVGKGQHWEGERASDVETDAGWQPEHRSFREDSQWE